MLAIFDNQWYSNKRTTPNLKWVKEMSFDLARRLRDYRAQNNISQEKMGELLGLSAMTVSRIETGRTTRLPSDLIDRVFDMLAIDLDQEIQRAANAMERSRVFLANQEKVDASQKAAKQKLKAIEIISATLAPFGYNICENEFYKSWTVFKNERWGKYWCVAFMTPNLPHAIDMSDIVEDVAHQIGLATLYGGSTLNGLSLVYGEEDSHIVRKVLSSFSPRVDFDVRLMAIDFEKEKVSYHHEITACFEGTGLFDIYCPQRSETERDKCLMEYGRFNSSFNSRKSFAK